MSVTEALGGEVLLLSSDELDPEIVRTVTWASMCHRKEVLSCEGANDPEVLNAINNPDPENPAGVFLLEVATGKVQVVRHLGDLGIEEFKAS